MPVRGEVILQRRRGQQRGRAQHVVAAAMAMAGAGQRAVLGDIGLLAEAGQRVVFAENGDDRAAFARLAHHGGRDAAVLLGHLEALRLQHGGMLGDGSVLGIGDFRHAPDAVAEGEEVLALGVDEIPDCFGVFHELAPCC